ncbi:thiamine pyrophosphate-dependent enzyme [Acidovorax sp. ACV01]|uniref:thiamine pyrophosphate-dependent enzyme n=1 Tax=Acidovorax sp. ACV01 TaxID=2769311 RepID=UPI001780362E|nr:thiamine pyrophosphate-dependent enzyme [Acidovorax sp. ACV01]MBD9394096.1 aldehyde dehydrogenase [Acidovorax sp. ACV01]
MNQTTTKPSADRREFVAKLIASAPEALIVTGLGSAAYDVFASGDRDKNYYLWGAMGGSTSIGLGLALAQPDKPVVVITGDGEQLMGIGSLATVAVKRPKNLTLVVLDNGHFGETGMQRSHSSLGTDLVAVAKGFGIADSFSTSSVGSAEEIAARINSRSGLVFAQVFIDANEPPRALPPRDGPFIKNRFRAALGLKPF